jgi:3-oxoacyl-[acyl-carrier-protein] synthase III
MDGLGLLHYIKNYVSQEVINDCHSYSLTNTNTRFFSHQASKIAVDTLSAATGISQLKFNTPLLGNLTSSSIPQQLYDFKSELDNNDKSYFITFGVGLKTKLALYEKNEV